MKTTMLTLAGFLLGNLLATAQEKFVYQTPPKEILELADFERAPTLLTDSKKTVMILQYRNTYKTLAELSEKEIRLAGLRIDPKTNIESGITYINNLKYKRFEEKDGKQIEGLPQNARMSNIDWSPDETKLSFTNTTDKGVELWYIDTSTWKAAKVSEDNLNANLGNPYTWFKDSRSFLIRVLPKDNPPLIDTGEAIPEGPVVTVSEKGAKAQNRTHQDLLQSPADEVNFETLATSELYKITLDGEMVLWKEKAMYSRESFSPDGNYVLISTIKRPFSYVVPLGRFPSETVIYDSDGNLVSLFNKRPLLEILPKGFMSTYTGKRNISWRADQPATLYWVEALDGGDQEVQAEHRDELFQVAAPFDTEPVSLAKTINRFGGILWGNETTAILTDRWQNSRNTKTYVINPSNPQQGATVISDRNMQDIYSDPGRFDTKRNHYGRHVLNLNGNKAYLVGSGYTEKGQFPFVDEIDLKTNQTKRLYQSNFTDRKLDILAIKDVAQGQYLVRLQSTDEYPNYYILHTKKRIAPTPVTHFENPFKSLSGVYKEVIRYARPDGVELTGILYLPAGYDRQNKERLPMIMWAYPTEYKDKNSAGQTTANSNEFIYPSYGSPIYWVKRGYAILDRASFPIIGEGDTEPNDSFIEQLVANAKAAIDAVDKLGYIDRTRVAVGGHSYGAFMTANLLTHSDLFAAGIARSGAYNRTLTPFGFQSEERNYWEAPDIYNAMSPFTHADKMKYPLLLIHGGEDNNSGTFTMQSERYFSALKGLGAPARFVVLPKERHGYAARESIMHLLWEQDEWLERYVKNRE